MTDKHQAARNLWRRGIQAVEFWNDGDADAAAQFLRDHVLELPIHQDIRPAQLDYTVDHILSLNLSPLECHDTVSLQAV